MHFDPFFLCFTHKEFAVTNADFIFMFFFDFPHSGKPLPPNFKKISESFAMLAAYCFCHSFRIEPTTVTNILPVFLKQLITISCNLSGNRYPLTKLVFFQLWLQLMDPSSPMFVLRVLLLRPIQRAQVCLFLRTLWNYTHFHLQSTV